ncbi:MAG: hypothetical protein E7319_06035 [Clostridiales bacterium]|nr:hypothetical protein [Clostridiales bacterium]
MRKVSAVLGIVVSVIMCTVGVLMAALNPLSGLMPETVPADVTTYAVPTVEMPLGEMQIVGQLQIEVPADELPQVSVPKVDVSDSSASYYSISDEYLFSYSFGADFYTEIYKASYKIFNQLLSMSESMDTINSNVIKNYNLLKAAVTQLNNLSMGFEGLANNAGSQYQIARTVAQQQNHIADTLYTLNNNLNTLYQAEGVQVEQMNNVANGMTRIIAMLALLIRAIGVLIVALGLMTLCKYLGMLSEPRYVSREEKVEA